MCRLTSQNVYVLRVSSFSFFNLPFQGFIPDTAETQVVDLEAASAAMIKAASNTPDADPLLARSASLATTWTFGRTCSERLKSTASQDLSGFEVDEGAAAVNDQLMAAEKTVATCNQPSGHGEQPSQPGERPGCVELRKQTERTDGPQAADPLPQPSKLPATADQLPHPDELPTAAELRGPPGPEHADQPQQATEPREEPYAGEPHAKSERSARPQQAAHHRGEPEAAQGPPEHAGQLRQAAELREGPAHQPQPQQAAKQPGLPEHAVQPQPAAEPQEGQGDQPQQTAEPFGKPKPREQSEHADQPQQAAEPQEEPEFQPLQAAEVQEEPGPGEQPERAEQEGPRSSETLGQPEVAKQLQQRKPKAVRSKKRKLPDEEPPLQQQRREVDLLAMKAPVVSRRQQLGEQASTAHDAEAKAPLIIEDSEDGHDNEHCPDVMDPPHTKSKAAAKRKGKSATAKAKAKAKISAKSKAKAKAKEEQPNAGKAEAEANQQAREGGWCDVCEALQA